MIDTLIVHGSFGSPSGNWFPWLANELSERGRRVLVPHFPDRELQNLENWTKIMLAYEEFLTPDFTVIAHSLGPAFVLDYCVQRKLKPSHAVLVAPFYDLISIKDFDEVNRTFFVKEKYISDFAKLCPSIDCVYSDNDPYVPRELSDRFAGLTGGCTKVVPGGKHLNSEAGYTEFPLLLDFLLL